MKKLRKLLIVAGQLGTGGAERELATFLSAIRDRHLETKVASLSRGGVFEKDVREITGHEVECPGSRSRVLRLLWMRRIVRSFNPDIIHTWNLFPLIYFAKGFLRRRCPVVGFMQQIPEQAMEEGLSPCLFRFLCRVPDGVVSNSRAALEALDEMGLRAPHSAVVYNGVEPMFFSSPPCDEAVDRKTERPVVVAVGRLIPRKRVDWMIQMAADLRQNGTSFDLWVIGDGPERARLAELSHGLGLMEAVTFWGSRPDVERILPAADVYLHCAWAEGLPNSLQEAMAVGLPVVAPRTAGIPEIVADGREGLLYEAQDYIGCRERLRTILSDTELRSELANSSKIRAETSFSPERMAEELLHFYSELLEHDATG